jgi:hypothetical protein
MTASIVHSTKLTPGSGNPRAEVDRLYPKMRKGKQGKVPLDFVIQLFEAGGLYS